MSEILIDLGNSALKWSLLDEPDSPVAFQHDSEYRFASVLKEKFSLMNVKKAYGCTVASKELSQAVEKVLNDCGAAIDWFSAKERFQGKFELKNLYKNPLQLGSDRWFASIGALSLHPQQALLVVHIGTASTVDSVIPVSEGKYEFLGGRIMPGPYMMISSLEKGTSKLSVPHGQYCDFPDNTSDAIKTGVIEAQLGVIEKGYSRMEKRGYKPKIIMAGGAAKMVFNSILQEFDDIDIRHNLVLHGLVSEVNSRKK